MINKKYKVVDYLTPAETCKAIGISEKSTPLITRWINSGKIKGYKRFGKSLAIPINWVKSECQERGINWQGVELLSDEIGVSLDDYMPIEEYASNNHMKYGTLHSQITRGIYNGNYIRFGTTFGLPRK